MSSHKRTVAVFSIACLCAFNADSAHAASPPAPQRGAGALLSRSQLIAQTPPAADSSQTAPVYKDLEALMKDYYPKAKITVSGTKFHCEFKCKTEDGYYASGGNALFPQEFGILCDISLEDGEYNKPDKDRLPSEVHDGFHSVLTIAPYSKKHNDHLLARLTFPADLAPDFKEKFITAVNGFNKEELAQQAADAKAAAEAATAKAAADQAARKAAADQAAANAVVTAAKPKLLGDLISGAVTVYISDSDNRQGAEIGKFPSPSQVFFLHVATVLDPGKKYYLHLLAEPPGDGSVAGCFGLEYGDTFALSGANSLDTRPSYWSVSNKGWGIECHRAGVSSTFHIDSVPTLKAKYPDLRAIMDPYAPQGTAKIYFSTTINPK